MILWGVILFVLISVVLTEALCQLWINALPVQFIREWLKSKIKNEKIQEFIDCKYCQSVWIGWTNSFFWGLTLFKNPFNNHFIYYLLFLFVMGIVIHRLSNYLHAIFDAIYYFGRSNAESKLLKDFIKED